MRIAQVAPLFESVPPKLYGGTERVVSYLTEELVRRGHDVTLYASGDSVTQARLVPMSRRSLRLDRGCVDQLAHHVAMVEQVARDSSEFDLIHWHIDYLHFPTSKRLPTPSVTTLHGRLDIPDLQAVYHEFADLPLVSISDSQREPLPWVEWVGTVHHGLDPAEYTFRPKPGEYLAFLGRMSPEKGVDRAIEIARRAGLPLKIAAKVGDGDRDHFNRRIEPLLQRSRGFVEFIGEIGGAARDRFLGGARALLFPINWPEPFGLVMIESMAVGTPVIAFRRGSVPEVMEDGVTGLVVDTVEQAVEAVRWIGGMDRTAVRKAFERRFSAARMTREYLAVYDTLLARSALRPAVPT